MKRINGFSSFSTPKLMLLPRIPLIFFATLLMCHHAFLHAQIGGSYKSKISADSLLIKAKSAIAQKDQASAIILLDQILSISQEKKDTKLKCQGFLLYGNVHYQAQDFAQAATYYNNALSIAIQLKLTELQTLLLEKLVDTHIKNKEFKEAESRCLQVINHHHSANNLYGQANAYSKLGGIYFELREMENAQKALDNASMYFKQIKKDDIKQLKEDEITEISLEKGSDNESAATQKNVSEENSAAVPKKNDIKNSSVKDAKHNQVAVSLKQIASVYKQMGNFSEAQKYFMQTYEAYREEENYHEMAACLVSIGDVLFSSKKYDQSLVKYREALLLSNAENLKISKMESYKGISLCLSLQNNYKQAFEYYQKYVAERDLIYAEEKENELQKLRGQLELENRQIQIRLLQKEKTIDALEIEKRNVWLRAVLVVLVLSVVFSMLLYNRYLLKKRLNQFLDQRNRDLERIIVDLKESEENLSVLNATKDRFFSIISHDMKAPLNSLKGYLSLAKEFPDKISGQEIKEFARIMDISLSNLSGLLNNLLEWAMIQSGAVHIRPEPVNLVKIVKKQAELFLPQFVDKNISFVLHSAEELELVTDKNMLEFVVRNMLHNAIKFTNPGGEVKVEIMENNQKITIAIQDNGIGIDEDKLANLFNPDTRNVSTGTSQEKGTGLGLMLCKDFVTMNQGDISVESKLGVGTKFVISYPVNE